MNSAKINIFDEDNNLAENFNETVELVLMGVHGEKYYDTDEELQDTRLINVINEDKVIENKETKKQKPKFLDFLPVIFFIIMAILLTVGGYFFLNNFDLTSLLGM